ncbi:hypothetical protein BdWA1_002187 [Babesia duncani]|uniref:PH domain-containing protein n=1 Tax=Babesia duncani TaxID=323732 RepID=A0AAD9UMN9_9APIC|nr:hypothetical protein BdWA1_003636 [Babesia duncani]KAK2196938.1 hypothetical protein BdWA1_002187 [Babesia duncani]
MLMCINKITMQINYLNIDLGRTISPLETVNSKCFSIRSINAMPHIICAGGPFERNKWMNAIEASILCASTGVKSILPLIPGEEVLEDLQEEKPSGLNLFIHDGKLGRPEIYINGKTTQQLEQERRNVNLEDHQVSQLQSFDHLFPNYESDAENPISTTPLDPEAISEAKAEAGLNINNVPDLGFYKKQHAFL